MSSKMLNLPFVLYLILSLISLATAQISSGTANYRCDPATCRLPDCACASTNTPGGLAPADTPQFILFTADDAVQEATLGAIRSVLGQRRNPNGCAPKSTYFASLPYTDYTHVQQWYVEGNEIADHTITHVGTPNALEIQGALIALNALAGIPLSSIQGFRAPYLAYNADMLKELKSAGFVYDSSATATQFLNATNTDAVWPYTLDNGLVNNCADVQGICAGNPSLPGLWELPMYATFDDIGTAHMMDPWMDALTNTSSVGNWLRNTFTMHYTANRLPVGMYIHPIHLVPSQGDQGAAANRTTMINSYLDWAQDHDDVWIVSYEQFLAWVRNPVPASQLGAQPYMACPALPQTPNICNGVPESEAGLVERCSFSEFSFYTCYGCPVNPPTPAEPNPAQRLGTGDTKYRSRLAPNCSTLYWDPIAGSCTCTDGSCAFQDEARPIGPGGASYLGGGTNENGNSDGSEDDGSYHPFNGAGSNFGIGGWDLRSIALLFGVGLVTILGVVVST